jgi:uncharacterized lipoprotein NlpE involved in copper resistance
MKKVLLAFAILGFVACNNEGEKAATTDSTTVDSVVAPVADSTATDSTVAPVADSTKADSAK